MKLTEVQKRFLISQSLIEERGIVKACIKFAESGKRTRLKNELGEETDQLILLSENSSGWFNLPNYLS